MHPLEALSAAVDPDAVTEPRARAALVHVTRRLRPLLHGPWPEPHQLIALAYAELAGDRFMCADEPGLGKTIIGLCRVALGGHDYSVIIAPTNVVKEWGEQAAKWLPGYAVHPLTSGRSAVPPAGWRGIVLTTWGLLLVHADELIARRPDFVIADEAHYANNMGTDEAPVQRTAALAALVGSVPHALLLTGTPFSNKAEELWTLLRMLAPRAWPSVEPFKQVDREHAEREAAGVTFDPNGADGGQLSTLQRRIRQWVIRRLKRDAQPDLKAKVYRSLPVALSPEERRYYDFVEQQFKVWLTRKVGDELIAAGYPVGSPELDAAIRARIAGPLRAEYLAKLGRLRQIVGRAKVPHAVAWIVGMVRNGEPVVAFVEHRDVLEGIAAGLRAHGVKHVEIAGKVPAKERQARKGEFMTGRADVCLCSSAGREGLTLTRARHLIHCERVWTSTGQDQASDRIHRIGQKRDATIWQMVVTGTIDARMGRISTRKRTLIEGTIGAAPVVEECGSEKPETAPPRALASRPPVRTV